jgi:hypothetical protein
MAAPKKVDYEAIEPGWRAGLKSPQQLAAEYTEKTGIKVSRSAIIKHFEKLGVPRDLRAKVMAKADAMVAQAMVTGKVSAETTVTTAEIVATAAADVAAIRLAHRGDITRMRSLVIRLLAECEAEAADPAVFESLGELLRNPDERGQDKLNEAYHKAISLPQRIKGVKELAEALRVLIALEREAYGIGVEEKPKTPLEDLSDEEIEARLRARLPA